MIKTIHIHNFQSLRDVTLELGALTVLCGSGDSGKSAILRAIRAAMLNDCNDLDISHGEKQCMVTFILEDDTIISWWKEKGKGGCYSVGLQEFLKTGGEVPEPVAKLLGVGVMEVDATTTLTPQLSDQFDSPFIIGETGSKRARILGKATRMNVVVGAQMKASSELNRFKRELTTQEEQLETATTQRQQIPDTDAMSAQLASIHERISVLSDSLRMVGQAREFAEEYEVASSRVTALDFEAARTYLGPLGELYQRLMAIQELNDRYQPLLAATERDFGPAYTALDALNGIHQSLNCLNQLAEQWEEIRHEITQRNIKIDEVRTKGVTLRQDLEKQCEEAGICRECGGLISHEICQRGE